MKQILRMLCCLICFGHGTSWGAGELPLDPRDAWIAGAITTHLEQQLGWSRDSYRLEVHEGFVTIFLPESNSSRREQLEQARFPVEGLAAINVVSGAQGREALSETSQRIYSFMGLKRNTIPFPTGDTFWPLLADPKQPEFSVSTRRYKIQESLYTVAAVGYGESFGFYRQTGAHPDEGVQISLMGGLFAQFDLGAPSFDLINADYTIGVPVTFRKGESSMRLRFYHQSSHLGDEFLLRVNPQRINLSYEALEYLYSHDLKSFRIYGGGEYMVHRDPAELKPLSFHGGVEYRGRNVLWRSSRWLGAVDIKSWQEHHWSPDIAASFGAEFGPPQPGRRRMRVMLEGYHGYNPHGQFYAERLRYIGVGVYLGF